MSLFALIAALLLEKYQPLYSNLYQRTWLTAYAMFFHQYFNTGLRRHGKIAWLCACLPLLACVTLISWGLYFLHPFCAWLFNVLMLYLTMGFNPLSQTFNQIYQALQEEKLDEARTLLLEWRDIDASQCNKEQIAGLTIESALIAAHRNVFGVVLWFVLFSVFGFCGATGALLYRLAQFLAIDWGYRDEPRALAAAEHALEATIPNTSELSFLDEQSERAFGEFSRRAFFWIDWLPIRISASTCAVVGNFEDTVYCWRNQAQHWRDKQVGILLASAAGAMGLRLGCTLYQNDHDIQRPELGLGEEADVYAIKSAQGLIWRSLALLLIVLLFMSLANLLG